MRIGRSALTRNQLQLHNDASRGNRSIKFVIKKRINGIRTKPPLKTKVLQAQASGNGEHQSEEAAELHHQQEELEKTLAELAKVANRLSKEDQQKLSAVIAGLGPLESEEEGRFPLEEGNSDEGHEEYPESVRHLFNMAGVLDAVPYDGTPVIKDGRESPLMPELSRYQWSKEDVRDTGRELTDEEWAQFFANELGEDPDDVSGDGGDGEDDSPLSQSKEDLDLPPSFADDEVKPGDTVAIEPSGDVEAMLALLESGQPLPPDPREAGTTREDAAAFTARLDKIVARYESQFLKRHEWRITTKEIREMEERWNALALRSEHPAVLNDITEVVPAPDFPPEVQQQWDRCQWMLYRLRRAHLDGPPAQPAHALASAGLVAEDVIFRDALLECKGLPAWLEYAQRVEQTGGYIELSNIWGSASEDRPDPQWHIVVDSWLNIPYPDWYLDYFSTHFNAADNPKQFLAAFAAAMADTGAGTPEGLAPYAEWGDRLLRPHKREKKVGLLSRDAYEGRPLSLQQRLRTGSVPVVEANPNLSIDDADAEGRPLPGTEGPSFEDPYRSKAFVADPSMGQAPFAKAARDPYSGGRNLLLPLFRRLQQSSMPLLNLLHLTRSGRSATGAHCASPETSSRTATGSADLENTSATSRGPMREAGHQIPESARPLETGGQEHARGDSSASAGSGETGSGADQGIRRYTVSAAEAVDAAGRTVREWKWERAKNFSWRANLADSPASEPAKSPSYIARKDSPGQNAAQGASLLERLKGSWRAVKPGVSVWTDSGDLSAPDELLSQLSELATSGDPEVKQLARIAEERAGFLRTERPRQSAVMENAQPPTGRTTKASTAPQPDQAAVSAKDEREAAVFTAAAQQVRAHRRAVKNCCTEEGEPAREAGEVHSWSRRSLNGGNDAGGPELKLLGAAEFSGRHSRVRVVADGAAAFATAAGDRPQTHRYRLVLPNPRSALTEQTKLRQPPDSPPAESASSDAADASSPLTDFAAAVSKQSQQGGKAQEGLVSGGDPVAAAAARLGLRLGSGSMNFAPAQAHLPAVPDLIGLFLDGSADSSPDSGDDSSDDSGDDISDEIDPDAASSSGPSMSGQAEQAGGSRFAQKKQKGGSDGSEGEEEPEQRAPLGMAWRGGRYMTIPMTTLYELNVETGQVDRITCHWNGIMAHVLGGPEDARDVYVRQTQLDELMYRPGFRICYKDLDLSDIPVEQAMEMP